MSAKNDSLERILLLRHHRRPAEASLAGTVDLARRHGSRLTFGHALEGGNRIDEPARAELLAELRAALAPHLNGEIADYRLLSGNLAEAAEAVAGQYDLVIPAQGGPGSEAERRELSRLLRHSPLPVWLDSGAGHAPRAILAAVDLQTRNPAKLALNPRIVRHAVALASRLDARLDLLTVRTPPVVSERLVRRLAGQEDAAISRREAREGLNELLSRASDGLAPLAAPPRLLVAQGDPDTLIAQAADSSSIDLLVAGCLGRGGLAGWLIGDTAARLSQKLPCSILAVKPSGAELEAQGTDEQSQAA